MRHASRLLAIGVLCFLAAGSARGEAPEARYVITFTATNNTGAPQGAMLMMIYSFAGLSNGTFLQGPPGCPVPTVVTNFNNVAIIWPCDCVQPGQSVTFSVEIGSEYSYGPPAWANRGPCTCSGLGQDTATAYLNSTVEKDESDRWAFTGNGCGCGDGCGVCPPAGTRSEATRAYPVGDAEDIGHPVDLKTGEVSMRVVDLRVPGRGIDWEFARRYRSRINFRGPLGYNWEFNYHMRLILDPTNGSFSLVDGNARSDIYLREPDGHYLTPPGSYNRVTVLQGNPLVPSAGPIEIEIANRHLRRTRFFVEASAPGTNPVVLRMTRVSDCHGNTLQFQYADPADPRRLTQVIDTYGRAYTYLYDGQGRLATVRDFMGREIVLGYDANGDLASVRSPIVTGTPNGNDFPDGKTERYTYSSGFSDPKLNHNLASVIAPNEGTSLIPRLQFRYQEIAGHPDLDKAVLQTWGGTNASGIPAGGSISYAYGAGGPGGSDSSTTVVDRSGNTTAYFFDVAGHVLIQRESTRGLHPGEPATYETQRLYDPDGQITRVTTPNQGFVESVYDAANPDRAQQGNLLSETRFPGPLGGDQAFLKKATTYEPIFNHPRTVVEERGNDPSYVPQNGGAQSAARYATTTIYDYQEGDGTANLAFLAAATGLTPAQIEQLLTAAGVPFDLPDQNGDGITNSASNVCGNPIRAEAPTVNLLPGGPQAIAEGDTLQQIVSTTVYNMYGQVVRRTDAEENVHERLYYPENDPDGDGQDLLATNGAGQPSDPDTGGYLRQTASDTASAAGRETNQNPAPANVRTDLFYDRVGNVTATLDGRGVRTSLFVNPLNQVVEIKRASDVSAVPGRMGGAGGTSEDLSSQAYAYIEHVFFDANDNVVRRNVENRDGNTPDGGAYPGFIETTCTYDILDRLLTETKEVSPTVTLTWQHRYDPNQNRIQTVLPEGNVLAWTYDERDLPLTASRGVGSADQSVVSFEAYDGNRNLLVFRDAEDNTGDGLGDPTTRVYDGYDRLARVTDAIGNVLERHYDPASNLVLTQSFGPIGGPSPTNQNGVDNVLLSQNELKLDELSRVFQTDRVLFMPAGAVPTRPVTLQDGPLTPGDLKVTTRFDYDRLSRLRFRIEDDLDQYRSDYDGVSRVIHTIDAEQNEVLTGYDDNANAVRAENVEKHPEGTVATQTFVTLAVFDSLNRATEAITNLGHTHRVGYDSRDNPVSSSDAQGPPSGVFAFTTASVEKNLPGNTARTFYDGLGRVVKSERDLRVGGQGQNPIDTSNPSNPDGIVTLIQAWDGNSRLKTQTDDLGQTTTYDYDALDRRKLETYADGRRVRRTFDRDDNVRTLADQNGSVRTLPYDGINRLTRCEVARGAGVVGTTLQTWEYDGLSRTTKATDDNDPARPMDESVVTLIFDSLSREVEEHQVLGGDDKIVSWDWQDDGLRKAMTFPDGRKVAYAWDGLDRLKTVTNVSGAPLPGQVAGYQYIGPGRLLFRDGQDGTRLSLADATGTQATGYDGDRRIVQYRHLQGAGVLAGFGYTHDRMDNRLTETRQHLAQTWDAWAYDSLYRLAGQERDLSPAGGPPAEQRAWTLDGAGSWAALAVTPASGSTQTFNQAMDPLNSYTLFQDQPQTDDLNGNRASDGVFFYRWDFLNRLRQVRLMATDQVKTVYRYDAWGANSRLNGAGRRIAGTPQGAQAPPATRYLYDGWRVVEERDPQDHVTQQYVDGASIDGHLAMDQYNADGVTLNRTLYYHEDAKGWVVALSDASGAVVERYSYDAYGKPTFLDAAGTPYADQTRSRVGNPYLYNGMRWDPEYGGYNGRHRTYSPAQGRWLSRDPIGIWEDGGGGGNGYAYVGGNAVNGWDPEGLDPTGGVLTGGAAAWGAEGLAAAGPVALVLSGLAVDIILIQKDISAYQDYREAKKEAEESEVRARDAEKRAKEKIEENKKTKEKAKRFAQEKCGEEEHYKPKTRDKVREKLPADKQMGGEDADPFKGKGPKKGTDEYEAARRALEAAKQEHGIGGAGSLPPEALP